MPAGFQQVMLPMFGDIDSAHRGAEVINNPEIPLRHCRRLEGVKERNQEEY
jgi:hypothetical protein